MITWDEWHNDARGWPQTWGLQTPQTSVQLLHGLRGWLSMCLYPRLPPVGSSALSVSLLQHRAWSCEESCVCWGWGQWEQPKGITKMPAMWQSWGYCAYCAPKREFQAFISGLRRRLWDWGLGEQREIGFPLALGAVCSLQLCLWSGNWELHTREGAWCQQAMTFPRWLKEQVGVCPALDTLSSSGADSFFKTKIRTHFIIKYNIITFLEE